MRRLLLIALALIVPAVADAQTCAPPTPPTNAAVTLLQSGRGVVPSLVTVVWVPSAGAIGYVVEVGSDSGVTDLVQFETGTTGTSTVQPAMNGTYYVRVRARGACGLLSGPSPEPVITITDALPFGSPGVGMVPDTAVGRADLSGKVVITGLVRGAWGSTPAAFVKVVGMFTSAAGTVVGSDYTYVNGHSRRLQQSRAIDDSTVGPGETACYGMHTSIPASSVTGGISASATWDPSAVQELGGNVVVQNLQTGTDTAGDFTVSGFAVNAGPNLTYLNQVQLDYRDAQERVADCDFTFVNGVGVRLSTGSVTTTGIASGQAASFSALSRVAAIGISRVNAFIAWQEGDSSGSFSTTRSRPSWLVWTTKPWEAVANDPAARAHWRNSAIDRLAQSAR